MAGGDRLTVQVDAEAWDARQHELATAERREAEHVGRERDAVVAAAQREGRITRPQARAYRKALDADPEGTQKLLRASPRDGGLPTNVVPVEPIGTAGGDVNASPGEDGLQRDYYDAHFPGLAGGD